MRNFNRSACTHYDRRETYAASRGAACQRSAKCKLLLFRGPALRLAHDEIAEYLDTCY